MLTERASRDPFPEPSAHLSWFSSISTAAACASPNDLEAWFLAIPGRYEQYELCTTSLYLDPASLLLTALGDTATLTATVLDANGDTVPDVTVTWTSSDTTIATVDTAGLVTAIEYGATAVTATSDSLSAVAPVQVGIPLTDREILEILYEATGGDDWTDNTNWPER